jgi:hypothetical protein
LIVSSGSVAPPTYLRCVLRQEELALVKAYKFRKVLGLQLLACMKTVVFLCELSVCCPEPVLVKR